MSVYLWLISAITLLIIAAISVYLVFVCLSEEDDTEYEKLEEDDDVKKELKLEKDQMEA